MNAQPPASAPQSPRPIALLADAEMVMILFRGLFIFAVFSMPVIFRGHEPPFTTAAYWAAVGAMVYNALLFLLHRRGLFPEVRRGFTLLADLALITEWVSLSGPPGWQFFPLYYTEVVAAAMWFGLLGSLAAGLAATCLYLVLVVGPADDPVGLALLCLTNLMPYTFILALLTGILAASETQSRRRAVEQGAVLQDFRDEIEAARRIEALTGPTPPPRIPGWGIGARYRSVRPFGGDMLGFLQPAPGILSFYVADVAGKTFPAIVNLPWIKKTLESAASAGSVSDTIEETNRLIVPGLRPNSFASLFYGMLDVRRARLRYVNAGNVPPLHYHAADKEVESLEPTGPVMGVALNSRYQEKQILLEPGDVLLAFTDGVTTAATARGDEFEEQGVAEFLLAAADLPAQAIADALFNRILIHEPRQKRDDLTILVIKAEGKVGE